MRNPRRYPPRMTWLDALVYRFQHRWETSPQYRAAATGVAGLVLVLLMCSCMAVVSLTANSALASIGLSGSSAADGGSVNTGTNRITGADVIPTATVPAFTSPVIPVTTIPSSQTPPPGPTPTPTPSATATDTPGASGGGGGSVPTGCTGSGFAFSPCPLIHGQAGSLTLTAPQWAGQTINALISFGTCSGTTACTIDITPSQGYAFNGSGVLVINFTVPAQVQVGQLPVSGMVNCAGGTIGLAAAPVQ